METAGGLGLRQGPRSWFRCGWGGNGRGERVRERWVQETVSVEFQWPRRCSRALRSTMVLPSGEANRRALTSPRLPLKVVASPPLTTLSQCTSALTYVLHLYTEAPTTASSGSKRGGSSSSESSSSSHPAASPHCNCLVPPPAPASLAILARVSSPATSGRFVHVSSVLVVSPRL
ncbi:hypothetical protein EV126DRAFT_197287 [Verticillium dahliae]|nr:hypothetical protein EV126DRAFT_197287 [Verticillium dahliae]